MSFHFWVLSNSGLYQRDFHPFDLHITVEKAGVEFITNNGWKISSEIIPMVFLITDVVKEGSLGMVTTFCHHDQVKVEPLEALSTLVQRDSLEPCVVVVKIFTNSPYLPWGSFGFPLPGCNHSFSGCINCQIPTGLAVLTQVAPLFFHFGHPAT